LSALVTRRPSTTHVFVELVDDAVDGARNRTLALGQGKATLVNEHDDGFDAAPADFRDERVDGLRLVSELEACDTRWGYHVGRVLECETDEGNGNAIELLHLVCREERLAGVAVEGTGGQVAKLCTLERAGALAAIEWMTAPILDTQELVLAVIELVVADRGDLKPHQGESLHRRLVMELCRQEWACPDQVASCHEHAVLGFRAKLLDERCHMLRATRIDRDPLGPVRVVDDGDAAARRLQVAVEVVDGEDGDRNRGTRREGSLDPATGRIHDHKGDQRQSRGHEAGEPAPLRVRHGFGISLGLGGIASPQDGCNAPRRTARRGRLRPPLPQP
jgi:hypothetical protein